MTPDETILVPYSDLGQEVWSAEFDESEQALKGSACLSCRTLTFPAAHICRTCGSGDHEPHTLATTGVVYSFTTVHISAERETPYQIGYVDLEDGLRILAPLRVPVDELQCGLTVSLTADGEAWRFEAA